MLVQTGTCSSSQSYPKCIYTVLIATCSNSYKKKYCHEECCGDVEALPPQLGDYARYVSTCFYYMFYFMLPFHFG